MVNLEISAQQKSTMKLATKTSFISVGAVLLSLGTAAQAEQIKLTEKCGPTLERKGAMNPSLSNSYSAESRSTPQGTEARFERQTKATPGTVRWQLISQGRGMYALSGEFERKSDGQKNLYAPVSFVGDAFPVVVKTRYLLQDGFRECEITLSTESGRPLKMAEVLSGPAGVASAPGAPVQAAQNQQAIAANSGRIDQNAQGIAQNKQDIGVNRQAITQNQQAIAANSGRIDQNAQGVAQNAQGVAQNRQDIGQNRQDIGVNRQAITQNQQAIAANQQEMKSRTTLVNEKYEKPVTGTAETWATYMSGVPFQQNQFCRIIQNWREELSLAQQQKNQIKENIAHRTREQRLTALMPDATFQNWIVRSVSVKQAKDGSAAVLFELPCDVVIGSHACGMTPKTFVGTIPENSRLYSELVSISVGDFLGVSGTFSFIDEKAAFKKDRSVASFTTMKAGTHCDAKDVAKPESEFYASQILTLSTLK